MDRYEHKGTWSESLGIFLYTHLVILNKEVNEVSINDYSNFELKDVYIKSYNDWLDSKKRDASKITSWVNKNKSDFEHFKSNFGSKYKPKVELWSDREKTSYYKEKLQASFEFENYIANLLMKDFDMDLGQYLTPEGQYDLGENKLGIEIKNDTLIKKWGNVYIEYAEKSNAKNSKYVDSGILKNDNSIYFLIGTSDEFWIFKKQRLIEIFYEEKQLAKNDKKSQRGILFKKKATSLGYVFPVKNAGNDTISIEEMVKEIKAKK